MRILTLYIIFIALNFGAYSQSDDVDFSVEAPKEVTQGERFQVSFKLNRKGGKNFKGPDFEGFQYQFGPGISHQSQMYSGPHGTSFIQSESYTYTLRAINTGSFKIEPATIQYDGKTYKSNSVVINVVGTGSSSNDNSSPTETTGDIFIKSTVSKSNVYKGEALIFRQKVYSRLRIVDIAFSESEFPAFNSFWTENIDLGQLKVKSETVNGKQYQVIEIYKTILIPQKTGKIRIDPTKLKLIIRSTKRVSSGWPGMNFQTFDDKPYVIQSNPVTINVKPIPENNKPAYFNGAVGNFNINASLEPSSVNAENATRLLLTIRGLGNIQLIGNPEVDFPDGLEVFDPETKISASATGMGVSGKKTYEYIIIPQIKGNFTIPSIKMAFFDPDAKRFRSIETGDLHLEVMESDGTGHYATTNMNKQAVKYYGSDIRYLKKITPNNLLKISLPLFSPLYFIIIVIAIAIFIAFIFYYRKRIKLTADIDRIRNKRASGVAKKRLKRAEKMMKEGNEEAFFTELIQTLWGYAADKLTINQTELSKNNIQNKLLNQGIDPVIAEQFIELIETCEYTRFAPKTEEFRMEKSYSDARSLIIAIENAR